jgi:hypothetical protein
VFIVVCCLTFTKVALTSYEANPILAELMVSLIGSGRRESEIKGVAIADIKLEKSGKN